MHSSYMSTCRRTLFIIRKQTILGIDILFAYFFFRNLVQTCLLDCYPLIPFSSFFFCNFMILFLVWRIEKLDNYILICNVTKHFTNKYHYFITFTYFTFFNNLNRFRSLIFYNLIWNSNMLSNLKMMYVNLHEL